MSILQHDDLTVFFGPPGTGKTTSLLNVVERECATVEPYKVGFVSFTKKAVREARDRAIDKFGYTEGDLPNFRTLHSIAYRANGIREDNMVKQENYLDFGRLIGADVQNKINVEENALGQNRDGDQMLFTDGLSRNRQQELYETWGEQFAQPGQVTWPRQKQFSRAWEEYKLQRDLWDYTDLLQRFSSGNVPKLDVLIVDECQDLSTLQWLAVAELAKHAQRVYLAGDDDQGIYFWSGANVAEFINIGGRHVVLDHSYRLPRQVYRQATRLLRRIHERHPKQFAPRDDEGEVSFDNELSDVRLEEGEWLLLARNNYMLRELEEYLIYQGFHYSSKRWDPMKDDYVWAVKSWEGLRRGKKISKKNVELIYRLLSVGTGVKRGFKSLAGMNPHGLYDAQTLRDEWGLLTDAIWHKALARMPNDKRQYLLRLLERGESLVKPPRIKLSTIHGAKGGEADNVLLLSDVSFRCWENQRNHPDDEHRTFYVGATRARRLLSVVRPQTGYYYDLQ